MRDIVVNYSGTSPLRHPPFMGHKIWSRKNVHIIFVSVTSIERTHLFREEGNLFWVPKTRFKFGPGKTFTSSLYLLPLLNGHIYSGKRETCSGSRKPGLTSIQGTPWRSNHKIVDTVKGSLVTMATTSEHELSDLKSVYCTCGNSTHNIAKTS